MLFNPKTGEKMFDFKIGEVIPISKLSFLREIYEPKPHRGSLFTLGKVAKLKQKQGESYHVIQV